MPCQNKSFHFCYWQKNPGKQSKDTIIFMSDDGSSRENFGSLIMHTNAAYQKFQVKYKYIKFFDFATHHYIRRIYIFFIFQKVVLPLTWIKNEYLSWNSVLTCTRKHFSVHFQGIRALFRKQVINKPWLNLSRPK